MTQKSNTNLGCFRFGQFSSSLSVADIEQCILLKIATKLFQTYLFNFTEYKPFICLFIIYDFLAHGSYLPLIKVVSFLIIILFVRLSLLLLLVSKQAFLSSDWSICPTPDTACSCGHSAAILVGFNTQIGRGFLHIQKKSRECLFWWVH